MALNLGILGQILTPAMAGGQKGLAMAEAESYRRRQLEQEAAREASFQAVREQLLQAENLRQQQMHPLQMQTEKARALAAMPTLAEAPERLGNGFSTRDQFQMEEIQSRIGENRAQTDLYRGQLSKLGKTPPKEVKADWQDRLDAIANSARGDPAAMHRQINEDPEMYGLRKDRTIRDYHVGSAANRAKKGMLPVQRDERDVVEEAGEDAGGEVMNGDHPAIPYRFRVFPSEQPEAWVKRMHRLGVDAATVAEYAQAQGLD